VTKLPITSLTAAVLTLIFIALCQRVVKARIATKTSLGDGGSDRIEIGKAAAPPPPLLAATRAHANFAEYAPLSLALLALIEAQGGARPMVLGLAIALLAARLAHPFGMGRPAPNVPRLAGFTLNIVMLGGAAVYLLYMTLA
jgi:uncharacterized protein